MLGGTGSDVRRPWFSRAASQPSHAFPLGISAWKAITRWFFRAAVERRRAISARIVAVTMRPGRPGWGAPAGTIGRRDVGWRD